ncbi:capsular polysaccharide biosynthesis protein [Wenxinia saemankumensis]|uniref:Capsular polysaccharide export protein n=1 Tax=Wenxinia saemankumensis TaxID=1447782 RepID=A0A1M6H072_9RHOB|nr:capsular polysaccharide biosynthesis protein [Wenxinia saemankumensis]SHJ15553.1 capsular polysaccharide export protein [Wenxinia saemankumensis]
MDPDAAAGAPSRRLFVYNGGFLDRRVRRLLALAGYEVRLGRPGADDVVGIWGQSPTARRGTAVAARTGAGILRVEDAFLRSVHPGRAGGGPPLGLLLDRGGVHFDPATVSDLERLLATHPLDDTALLDRARAGIDRMRAAHLTKYTAFDPSAPVPGPGYVLVVDQVAGDASVRATGGGRHDFLEMLHDAAEDHPGARIVVKGHPETAAGRRAGHLTRADLPEGAILLDGPVSPWRLLEGAIAVHAYSSQLGFEAILAGHRPRIYGQPFYAGWGLTEDRAPLDRRQRRLTRAQLFAGAMILAPVWIDPYRDRRATFEEALDALEAETRAWREDRRGWVGAGMRAWKRGAMDGFFGGTRRMVFAGTARAPALAARRGRRLMVWANRTTPGLEAAGALRVEDGFLRSSGLGAALVPPMSLALDDLGIYYDPGRESRLERLIAASVELPLHDSDRAARLVAAMTGANLTKYNLRGDLPALPEGRRLLVPGQVEDDASIRLGAGAVRTNRALLQAARAAHPEAILLYKPHPDVEAGLRPGRVADAGEIADLVLEGVGAAEALAAADAVWTMTSTLGFEALLRGLPVTCLGAPFYAGWGLTEDLGPVPARRTARPTPQQFAYACLIGYPRYRDPVTGRPCPPEVVLDRLARGEVPRPGRGMRALSRLQGRLAGMAWLWR